MKYTLVAALIGSISALQYCKIDERENVFGAHRCRSNSHCEGNRTCSRYRWCQGRSGCVVVPKCRVNEKKHVWGAHRCRSNSDCEGKRTCSRYRWCQGVSGCRSISSEILLQEETEQAMALEEFE